MTVHELITILQQFNPDTEIQLANERWSAPIRGGVVGESSGRAAGIYDYRGVVMTVAQLIKILQTLDQEREIYCTEVSCYTPETQKVGSVELEEGEYMIYGDQL